MPLLILSLLTTHDCHIKESIGIIIEWFSTTRDRTSEKELHKPFFGKVSDLVPTVARTDDGVPRAQLIHSL
jgi:hypothetical protein